MKNLTKTNLCKMYLICLLMIMSISGTVILPLNKLGITLFLLMLLVCIGGIFSGLLIALGLTLLLYFMFGSAYFWFSFISTQQYIDESMFIPLLVWMISLLLISIFSGRISFTLKALQRESADLKSQITNLVAVDPVTGFDNKERMFLELEYEHSRSKRYGHTYAFLLIKIKYIAEFKKLYGEKELNNLFVFISKGIYQTTRKSDQKYRPGQDVFALLLTDTSAKDVQIIIRKLNEKLSVFELQNETSLTLSFEFGYTEFNADIDDHKQIYDSAMEQVSAHVS